MNQRGKGRAILFVILLCLLLGAAAVYAQIRDLGPSMDMVNLQQIQALRAELAKLRVELIACHDELNQVRKQLELCEKNASSSEPGSSPVAPVKTEESPSTSPDATPAP